MTGAVDWGLLHNQPRLYADAAQFVSSIRNGVPAAREAIFDFIGLGVSNSDIEQMLINMHVHGKLVGAYLAVMAEERASAARARVKIQWIKGLLTDINSRALAIVRHGVPDGTSVSIEVFSGADAVEAYFENYPEEATKTQMRLGLAPERVRDWERAAERAAVGRFAYLMRELTPGRQTHPQKVAALLCAFEHYVDYMDVRNCLRDYEKRLGAAGA
jgi:hypothetical protein